MRDFVVVLSADDMEVLDEALSRYEESYTHEEWQEMPEARAKLDALIHKLHNTAKFVAETQGVLIDKGDKPEEA